MNPVIIIDPGHGGRDYGGGSNKFWKEKNLNLRISLYQYQRYKELGIPVAMTRVNDKYLTSKQRAKIVRESGSKYCHSNHVNAGGGGGAELIHSIYSDGRMARDISKHLKEAGQNVRRVFTRTLSTNERRDYYFMHRDTGRVETVIIEYGFADSSLDDLNQLRTNWKDYAEAVVKGFCTSSGYNYHVSLKKSGDLPSLVPSLKYKLILPENADYWRVYPLDVTPIKGNEKGFLRPSKFGGLTYTVKGESQAYVYIIDTIDFGTVQIYAHSDTGATVKVDE